MKFVRVIVGGVAAAVAWWVGIAIVFGPAQAILADPGRQSAKFLAAFSEPPLPRVAETPGVFAVGLLIVAVVHSGVYAWLQPRLSGPFYRRGATFGIIAWALMVPWFEFYLPWNVMREPFALVLLEVACWLGVQLLVGVTLAGVHTLMRKRKTATA